MQDKTYKFLGKAYCPVCDAEAERYCFKTRDGDVWYVSEWVTCEACETAYFMQARIQVCITSASQRGLGVLESHRTAAATLARHENMGEEWEYRCSDSAK